MNCADVSQKMNNIKVNCHKCSGTGRVYESRTCTACYGSGCASYGEDHCSNCGGSGSWYGEYKCDSCGGAGGHWEYFVSDERKQQIESGNCIIC